MGLLDKAAKEEFLPVIDTELMMNHIKKGTGLLERVPLFFSFIIDFWNIKKGAFLSLKDSHYLPVETVGFDTTSIRKIRVSSSLLKKWELGKEGKFLEKKSLFEDLFSLREASLVNRLLVIPLYYKTQIPFALIMFVFEEEDNRLFKTSFPLFSHKSLMEMLNKSLYPFSDDKTDKPIPMDNKEIEKEITTDGENRIIMQIAFTPLLKKIGEVHGLRDSYDLKNELLSLFSSFFNERVNLYLNKSEILIISYPLELFPGEKLMISQILNSLNELYGSFITDSDLSVKVLHLSENEIKKDYHSAE